MGSTCKGAIFMGINGICYHYKNILMFNKKDSLKYVKVNKNLFLNMRKIIG